MDFRTRFHVLLCLAAVSLGLACVDLDPPWTNVVPKTGGSTGTSIAVGEGGASADGPGADEGLGVGGGMAIDGGGAGGAGGSSIPDTFAGDGATGSGGELGPIDAAGGVSGLDGDTAIDSSIATGGSSGTGGGVVADGRLGSGGSSGTGGKTTGDGSVGTGGSSKPDSGANPDVPLGTGGVVGTGGTLGTGGSVGSGGTTSSGGAIGTGGGTGGAGTGGAPGTGGSTVVKLECTSPIVPANGSNGGVTDFADFSATTGQWGPTDGLHGGAFGYAASGSTIADTVDGSGLHLTGTIAATAGAYGGGGLSYHVCTTVAQFTRIQFTVQGSTSGCDMELQIRTFDQLPAEQNPGGGCYRDAGGSCFGFPHLKPVAVPTATPTDVVKPLASFTNWSTANANQVVGLQWQLSNPSSASTCPIDVTITNIKFLP
jgi:hypothetical protein